MASDIAAEDSVPSLSLEGRKVYSPGTIAAYTALANLPMGLILYGLNLKARGQRRLGLSMALFGAAALVLLVLLPVGESLPRGVMLAVGICGAVNVYKLEKRPFEISLREGATRARWWPPTLFILGGLLALLVLDVMSGSV